MSLDPPTYVVSLQNNIRARPVSWEGAVRAKTITETDLKQIKSIDKVRKEQRKQTIEADIQSHVTLFFGGDDSQSIFRAAAKREDIVQYLLVLISDIIEDIETFTTAVIQHSDPFAPLLPFLKHSGEPSDPIPLLTSMVISSLISRSLNAASKTPKAIEDAIPKLNSYLSVLAHSSDSSLQDIAVQQYSAVLRNKRSRELFWSQRPDTLAPLIDILRAAAGSNSTSTHTNGDNYSDASTLRPSSSRASIRSLDSTAGLSGNVSIQLLYHVLLVIWQLSFSPALVGPVLDHDHNITALYTTLLRVSPKEKLTRLLISTLANLLSIPDNADFLLPAALTARLPTLLSNLKSRHLTDTDLLEDLDALKSQLDEYSKTQTTLSAYAAELRSGHLRWTPLHRDAGFWAENARAVVSSDKGALVHSLADILAHKWEADKAVLAVACNDVGWLVKEAPDLKAALEKAGIKARVMALMQSEDESVRWEALRATGMWLRYSFDG